MRRVMLMVLSLVAAVWCGSSLAQAASKYNISIDGNFSDWSEISKSTFNGGNHNGNGTEQAAFLADDDNVYFYLDTAPDTASHGASKQKAYDYTLKVGNKDYDLTLTMPHGLGAGKVKAFTISANGAVVESASGIVNREKTSHGNKDVLEMRLPLSALNVSKTASQNISISDGTDSITTTGGSTGPVVLAAIGFGIAGLGVMRVNKKRKQTIL